MELNLKEIRPYKKGAGYSYTLGAFPTMELIKKKKERAAAVVVSSRYEGSADFKELCEKENIRYEVNDKLLNRLSTKENCFVAGIFEKYEEELRADRPHVVLVNVSDMGNLGTIIRTLAGLGIPDLGIIAPCADHFNPKTVRASMGALFSIRIKIYDSFEEYKSKFPDHELFPFMLDGENTLSINEISHGELYTLIFGNEATGLPKEFAGMGRSIFIPQTETVDSLNLPISVGIGTFSFVHSLVGNGEKLS